MPVSTANFVLLARSVSELWLLLYTVYENTVPTNGNFVRALRDINVSVYVVRYTLSVLDSSNLGSNGAFREEGL